MIWNLMWILPLIVFILVVIVFAISQGFDSEGIGAGLIVGALVFILTGAMLFIITGIMGGSADKTYVVSSENQIYANSEGKYVTMDNGSKQFKVYIDETKTSHIDVSQSSSDVIENGDSYYIRQYSQVYASDRVKWLLGETCTGINTKYEISIPKGSISTENKVKLN